MALTLDGVLSEPALLARATERIFARGEDYVRYVQALRVTEGRAEASVQAKRVYAVRLTWDGGGIEGTCTCPHTGEGNFCKHLVAVGLAALDQHGARTPAAEEMPLDPVQRYLDGLAADELRRLVLELSALSESGDRLLTTRAATAAGDVEAVAGGFLTAVKSALTSRGFIDYRRSFGVASAAEEVLDEIERHLDGSQQAADAARPALEHAVKRLRAITERADDSSGVIGQACQRAADLHARSCVEGQPDATRLAKWLVSFRSSSPGWPETPLSGYAAAFDDKALATYRRGVEAYARSQEGQDRWARFGADQMLLELADHDGDVDAAVEILSAGEHPSYGGIIERLRAAGRDREAMAWTDRAIEAGRLSEREGNDFWLFVPDVLEALLADGRREDALALARGRVQSGFSPTAYRQLLDLADRLGEREEQQTWALALAEERAGRSGNADLLVALALADLDVDRAWAAHERYGVSSLRQTLAEAVAKVRPREAADLLRPVLQDALRHADRRNYRTVAQLLERMRALYGQVGAAAEIDALVVQVREDYRRRPTLLAELDRHGLAGRP